MAVFNSGVRGAATVVRRVDADDEVQEGANGAGSSEQGDPDGSSPSVPTTAAGAAIFVLALALAVEWFGTSSGPTFKAAEGLGVFALFYVVAQAAERLLELLMPIVDKLPGLDKPKSKKERDTAVARALKSNLDNDANKAAKKQAEVDQKTANRTVVGFALTAATGMLACAYLEADFMTAVGVGFGESTNSEWFRMAVTGLVVGGGSTKLHELITNMSKSSAKKDDPAATGGTV